jgi:hypothetical protein
MRAVSMLPLAFWAALLAGCAAESPRPSNLETASSGAETGLSDRDLTLQTPAMPAVEVASPIELSRPTPEPRPTPRPRISSRPAPVPTPDPVPEASPADESAVPVPTVAVAEVMAEPAPVEDVAVGVGRELAPGKTVTIIPTSSGPSSAPEDPSWAPAGRARSIIIEGGGGGGGKCRPRGGARGIGIGGRIPIGVPGRRLR